MKKIILSIALVLITATSAFSQGNFKVGVNAGLPVGDLEEFTTFHLGADLAYMFGVAETIQLGPMVGYSHFFGDSGEEGPLSWEVEDIQFVPVALSGRVNLTSFFLGADLGYALGINDGNDGGFYYRPQVGFNLGKLGLVASYSGVSLDGGSANSVNLGIEFGL